ncbi:MAG: DUF3060 domain-containing protein [Pyrinomonadaceae bacterium]
MRRPLITIVAFFVLVFTGCEVQSEIAKKSVEDFQPSPTPVIVKQTPEPIDPADVVTADTSKQGATLFANEDDGKKNLNCKEYNRVMINGSGNEITLIGVCSQIMVNGSRNQIVGAAATEIVTYGSDNTISYSKYVNGNKPQVKDSSGSNTISKSESVKTPPSKK